ncbi:MAG: glycerol-3-phosphate 1-O-acyltransferase PlsY [Alphaproteobacteria bacterium]|nr:glycerol-3-phosphate 1-O-acyltransferase PlsY [Alphaproteobacteria bacterium]
MRSLLFKGSLFFVGAALLLWATCHTPYFAPYGFGFLSAVAACAYLLGSVPYGLLLTKFFGGEDLRTVGSGNIGATNVLRTGRKALAFFTLLLDALKAALAIYLAKHVTPPPFDPYPVMLVAATFAILGHLFPIWLSFKGGKGIASCAGSLFMLSWPVGLITLGTWVFVFGITKISSLAAFVAILSVPVSCYLLGTPVSLVIWFSLIAFLVLIKHRDNLKRLTQGKEAKIDLSCSRKSP